jgi:hypothetical protein
MSKKRREEEYKTIQKFSKMRVKLVRLSLNASSDAEPRVRPNQNKA